LNSIILAFVGVRVFDRKFSGSPEKTRFGKAMQSTIDRGWLSETPDVFRLEVHYLYNNIRRILEVIHLLNIKF
jgi:hypothetical protein